MNVYRHECKKHIASSLLWALSLVFFGIVCLCLFASFTQDIDLFERMLSGYSPTMLKAFGASIATIKTYEGFYAFCFMYISFAGCVYALYLGLRIIGGELSEKSAEFLYTKPRSRERILTQKMAAALTCILLINVLYSVGTVGFTYISGARFDVSIFLMVNASMLIGQCMFLSLGFLCACVAPVIKTPLSVTMGVMSALFLLQTLVNVNPTGLLSYVSPLSYVSGDAIVQNQGFDVVSMGLVCLVIVLCLSGGYAYFVRRDIHA